MKTKISTVALVVTVAAAIAGLVASPALASGANKAGEHRASEWTDATAPAHAPSLTNEATEPSSNTGSQLGVGFVLVGLGALALLSGAATVIRRGGRSPGTDPGEWPDPLARAHS